VDLGIDTFITNAPTKAMNIHATLCIDTKEEKEEQIPLA